MELSDELSSDSVPNTPTLNMTKPRFSFPRIIHSKLDTGVESVPNASESDKKVKKDKKNEPKKSEKYKESVIYR